MRNLHKIFSLISYKQPKKSCVVIFHSCYLWPDQQTDGQNKNIDDNSKGRRNRIYPSRAKLLSKSDALKLIV